eukprot:NODE_110_length_19453_cov_0.364369.p9 type:complete len:246 gc:universal NODE_110_length_19453_cov_0.364369:16817-17554(+)
MLEIADLFNFHHLSQDNQPIVSSLTYSEFNSINKTLDVNLHEYDHYFMGNEFFILTWAQHREPVHFIVFPSILIIVNGHDDVFLHLQNKIVGSSQDAFHLCMLYLLQELQQICTSVEFDVMTIQDLVGVLADKEFKDLLLRIRNTQTLIYRLKYSVRMKKCMTQRCNLPMYNNLTELMLLEDKLNQYLDSLDVMYNHYLGDLNMKMTMSSNTVNFVMRKLTLVTIAGIPMTVISGMWGNYILTKV